MNATIVTCYYRLNKSKHTIEEYTQWIRNFILHLKDANLVVFTCEKDEPFIRDLLLENLSLRVVLMRKEIEEFRVSKQYPAIWEGQEAMDPNPSCGRGIDCYKIWNTKFEFLKEAIDTNPFQSEYFVWNDIGNVREDNLIDYVSTYPSTNKFSRHKLDIVILNGYKEPKLFFQNEVHFSGSLFGSHKDTLLDLYELFYLYFDIYVEKGYFIGCDQQIFSTLWMKHPDRINPVIPFTTQVDPWFYLYEYYSAK